MPEDQAPPSIAEQYATALSETNVSQKELARRLANTDDHKKVENKRRQLAKIARGETKRPRMTAIEKALSLPRGYFQIPSPAQVRASQVRLEELAAQVARDREAQLTFAEEVLARLAALEGALAPEAQQSVPQAKPEDAAK